jgi:GNAT superfamily N-acetyltransferase
MLESLNLIVRQLIEAFAEGGVRKVLRSRVFWNRLATPAVMELSTSNLSPTGLLQSTDFQFVEITTKDLQAGKFSFAIPGRGLKALRNLKKGWRGFAITKDSVVVGDVWCLTPHNDGKPVSHPDLEMLGIICKNDDAYAFDMFIAPVYRGKNLAAPLQKSLQATLKMEGCARVYGYYWDDNLPALWMHRILKFKELPKRRISRFFFLINSKDAGPAMSSSPKTQNGLTQHLGEKSRNLDGFSEQNETENIKRDGSQSETRVQPQQRGGGSL